MLLGIQGFMFNLVLVQQVRQVFGYLNRGGTNEHRLFPNYTILDVFNHGLVFLFCRKINQVAFIIPDHRFMGWYNNHFQSVNLLKFKGFGICRTRHAGQFVIQSEIILEGNRGNGLVFMLNLHPFLGLYSLMQAIRPASSGHGSASEFIDNDHLVILDDIVDILLVNRMSPHGRI